MSGSVTSSSVFYAEESLPVANGSTAPTLLICLFLPRARSLLAPRALQPFTLLLTLFIIPSCVVPTNLSLNLSSNTTFSERTPLTAQSVMDLLVFSPITLSFSLFSVFFCYTVPSWLCMRLFIYLWPCFNGEQNFFYFIFFCIFNTFRDNRCLLNICGMDEGEKN